MVRRVQVSAIVGALLMVGCDSGPVEPVEPDGSGSPLRVRLLTPGQYSNSIAQIFGADVSNAVLPPLPQISRIDGLISSGAASVGVTSDQIEQIQQAAITIAAQVVDSIHRDFLIPCKPASATEADAACAEEFLLTTTRLLHRSIPGESKVIELVDIANRGARESDDFYAGLALALEALLFSPEFIFVTDSAEPDPERPGYERLDAYSLASRLSFFLWNSTPDHELLLAAENGELQTVDGLERAVDRMLTSSKLEDGIRAFFDDMMAFDEFDSLAKDPSVYPMVTGGTLADAREQTLRTVIDHLLRKELDYRDLFTTRHTFMSPNLAVVYGVPTTPGWVPYEFGENEEREGLLTHISFLAANSHPVRSSPTLRGQAMRELFLCQVVPAPPPNVDFSALEEAGDVPTARERLKVHNTNPSCAGCHLITDPIGLSLENFDGAGRYRKTENGAELDVSGELDGIVYTNVQGLTAAMRDHPKLSSCLVKRTYAYAIGGPLSLKHDRDTLSYFEDRFIRQGHKLRVLLRDIALSDAFSGVRPDPEIEVTVAGDSADEVETRL
jgi:uncharacterized protein YerC